MMNHIGLIMDGNRRWAKKRAFVPWRGHREGVEAVRRVVEYVANHNIKHLSLYAFSLENFKRSKEELDYLFDLVLEFAQETLQEFVKEKIRVRFVGDRSLFPKHIVPALEELEEQTKNFDRMVVHFLFCYGGRQELIAAGRCIADQVQRGELTPMQVDEDAFASCLWTHGMPDVDLIIRTGGRHRLSNFLPYQSIYSELYFTDLFWPDIQAHDLDAVLEWYQKLKRSFGK